MMMLIANKFDLNIFEALHCSGSFTIFGYLLVLVLLLVQLLVLGLLENKISSQYLLCVNNFKHKL